MPSIAPTWRAVLGALVVPSSLGVYGSYTLPTNPSREDIITCRGIEEPSLVEPRSRDRVHAPNIDITHMEHTILLAQNQDGHCNSCTLLNYKSKILFVSLSDNEIISREVY
jgi:hypothetical protein